MKKTYIIPETLITRVNVERMVAASPGITETVAVQEYGMEVKQDRGYRQDYNVWSDDWSK